MKAATTLLSLADRSRIMRYLKKFPPSVSELTFTNLFIWRHSRPVWYAEVNGTLVFLVADREQPDAKLLFGSPVGPWEFPCLINDLGDTVSGALRLSHDTAMSLQSSGISVIEDRDNADYVYLVSDLAELSGRKYAKKRNHIHQCLKENHCEYEPLSSDNLHEVAAMQEKWCVSRQCGREIGLCQEFKAITETFDHYQELDLIGGAVRIEGEIKAYSIGERLSTQTAVCHFEKAMPDVHGLSQLINQWFAKYSLSHFTLVNREQDLGIPGLRRAKESYYPDHLVMKYKASLSGKALPQRLWAESCPPLPA